MEEIKTQLTQTGFNLERLHQDNKIDDRAYEILKNRNEQALNMCGVGVRSEQLKGFKEWLVNEKKNVYIYDHHIEDYIKTL